MILRLLCDKTNIRSFVFVERKFKNDKKHMVRTTFLLYNKKKGLTKIDWGG